MDLVYYFHGLSALQSYGPNFNGREEGRHAECFHESGVKIIDLEIRFINRKN
jgi:hypothetical protein